ncbi:MAG: nitronate monooxygenase [Dehalococcoidia bacterium]|nr:nitronate monooxygenase [Dehalococcoidia bacterium]
MLVTDLTRRLGIDHPLIQAGMGSEAGPELAAAVSNAGGLGTIGTIGMPPEMVRAAVRKTAALTQRPFSANIVTFDWAPFAPQLLDVVLEEQVPIVTLSFGTPLEALERCRAAGLKAIVQVQTLEGAKAAIAAAPDVLIVQGSEAGGHSGRRGTLNFAAQVLELAGDLPVVIAGGVANGRGLAAALAMGAAGVVMGTRFKASAEFAGTETQKAGIVRSDGSNTVQDGINDIAYGLSWPSPILGRTLESKFTREWLGRDEELREVVASQPMFAFAQQLAKSPDTEVNWAGESSGLIDDILPAAEIIRRTVAGAERHLEDVARLLEASTAAADRP